MRNATRSDSLGTLLTRAVRPLSAGYPKRNGSTTRYLSEPEVATAYRDRFAGAQGQTTRVEKVEQEAIDRLDTTGQTWVVVSLVPDLAGDMTLSRDAYQAFQQQILSQPSTVIGASRSFIRTRGWASPTTS
ncbi:MAG: hypothetical protein ACRDRQ_26590 [Pseudonocardiaceae bacterium]